MNDEIINKECTDCLLIQGCYMLCCLNRDDVFKAPCEKYAIGYSTNKVFWTKPADNYAADPLNPAPDDVKFVIV